jgi:phenylpropionate dioxygenase-like ring-hydroxylating dioxygenase large terminal subunit
VSHWHASLQRRWFAAARVQQLGAKPLAVTVMDTPLVLARLETGELLALQDRCPHRQVPLSAGQVTPDGLRCPYHGWTFSAGGRCSVMPGLAPGTTPPDIAARAVSVCELDGLVWVRLGPEGDGAPPEMISSLPAGSRRFLWQTSWGAHVVDAIENFLDPLHTHLVHPGLVRRNSVRHAVDVMLSDTPAGFRVDYRGQPQQSGLLYRLFESPRESECALFEGAGSAQLVYRYRTGAVARITLHFTPESATRTHVFTTLHVENRWAPAWAVRLFVWPFLKRVALQDQKILEMQSANLARFGGGRGVSTPMDLVRERLEHIWHAGETTASRQANRITLYL